VAQLICVHKNLTLLIKQDGKVKTHHEAIQKSEHLKGVAMDHSVSLWHLVTPTFEAG